MSNIGRPRVNLSSEIDKQIVKTLRREGLYSLKETVSDLDTTITQVSISETEASSESSSSTVDSGYDYSQSPPEVATFGSTSLRIDNLDTYLIGTLIPLIEVMEGEIETLQSEVESLSEIIQEWYTVLYVPDTVITSIAIPHTILQGKVWKNGLRMFEGSNYDYSISGSSIIIDGIAEDRFIIEYTTSWSGS